MVRKVAAGLFLGLVAAGFVLGLGWALDEDQRRAIAAAATVRTYGSGEAIEVRVTRDSRCT